MLSTCSNCGAPTDMALGDVITDAQVKQLPNYKVPLVGTCGETACTAAIVERLARTAAGDTDGFYAFAIDAVYVAIGGAEMKERFEATVISRETEDLGWDANGRVVSVHYFTRNLLPVDPAWDRPMPIDEFREQVKLGLYKEYDGYACPATLTHRSVLRLTPSEVAALPADVTHVCWYNR